MIPSSDIILNPYCESQMSVYKLSKKLVISLTARCKITQFCN